MRTSDMAGIGSALRFHQVLGDTMEPTICNRDYVLVAPAHRYAGEGFYLVADHFGSATPFSCSVEGTRSEPMIRLHAHNKFYPDDLVTVRHFEEHVLAQVVMTCRVVRPDLLKQVARMVEA